MKKYILISLFLVAILSFCTNTRPALTNDWEMFEKIFTHDSGYISKEDALRILLYAGATDTINCTAWVDSCYNPWTELKIADSIGKYSQVSEQLVKFPILQSQSPCL